MTTERAFKDQRDTPIFQILHCGPTLWFSSGKKKTQKNEPLQEKQKCKQDMLFLK